MTKREELLKKIVAEQADDDGLWFIAHVEACEDGRLIEHPITISEHHLQEQLRRLHRAIEEGTDPGPTCKDTLQ